MGQKVLFSNATTSQPKISLGVLKYLRTSWPGSESAETGNNTSKRHIAPSIAMQLFQLISKLQIQKRAEFVIWFPFQEFSQMQQSAYLPPQATLCSWRHFAVFQLFIPPLFGGLLGAAPEQCLMLYLQLGALVVKEVELKDQLGPRNFVQPVAQGNSNRCEEHNVIMV